MNLNEDVSELDSIFDGGICTLFGVQQIYDRRFRIVLVKVKKMTEVASGDHVS